MPSPRPAARLCHVLRRPGLRGHRRAMATGDEGARLDGRVIDGSVATRARGRIPFPVFSAGVAPSTTINHFRFAGANIRSLRGVA